MKVLEKIAERLGLLEKARTDLYASLVNRIVTGEEPALEEVVDVLRLAGRTFDDLQADVQRKARRKALREKLDARPSLMKQWERVSSALERGAYKNAKEREELEAQKHAVWQKLQEALNAQDELFATAPEDIKNRLYKIGLELDRLLPRIVDLKAKANNFRSFAEQNRRMAEEVSKTMLDKEAAQIKRESLLRKAEGYDRMAIAVEKELSEAKEANRQLQAEQDRLYQEALTP